jgi:pimeloyl-ACP methyl ester carboxylesterase
LKESRKIYRLVGVGAAVAAVMPALVGGIWGWLGAHPPRLVPDRDSCPDHWGSSFREIVLQTPDGLRLAAWHTPPVNGVLILVAHGYANARLGAIHALFTRHGYGALSWDFRAHGESDGAVCSLGYYEHIDVETALDYALAQPDVTRVGLWGASMGGIAGLRAAERRPEIEALVLDSVPATLEEAFEVLVRPASLRPVFRWVAEGQVGHPMAAIRPVERITRLDARPVLAIQCGIDEMIPLDSAQRLSQAGGDRCTCWVIPEAKHLQACECRPAEYETRVIGFFDAAFRLG